LEKAKINQMLRRSVPKDFIKQKKGRGGKHLDYVEWTVPAQILIDATENTFDFQITGYEIVRPDPRPLMNYNKKTKEKEPVFDEEGNQVYEDQAPVVVVYGKMHIPGLGVREQFGAHVLDGPSDQWGDAFKAAASDCFKKCASLFGVCLDLYGDELPVYEEENEAVEEESGDVNKEELADDDWDPEDVELLKSLMAALGIEDNEELDPYVQEFSEGQLESHWDITPENIKAFNAYLESLIQE